MKLLSRYLNVFLLLFWLSSSAIAEANLPIVALNSLPPEVKQTLQLVRQGGPFPNRRDGVVFANRERILPRQKNAYYHEYTVATPGLSGRGARRLVVGGMPQTSQEIYYSDDHYRSFKQVRE